MISLKAPAKINLSLDLKGRRADGYHEIRTIMQTLELSDEIRVSKNGAGTIEIKIVPEVKLSKPLPKDGGNLMYKAAELVRGKYGINEGVNLELVKRIPAEAGLGGGSSDAAAVIKGMSELFGLGMTEPEMEAFGLALGADVPFFIRGGTALCEGTGEMLTPLKNGLKLRVLLLKPNFSFSTGEMYERYDRIVSAREKRGRGGDMFKSGLNERPRKIPRPDTAMMIEALSGADTAKLSLSMGNVFESATGEKRTYIEELKALLRAAGAKAASMTGSGSVVYGLFAGESDLAMAYETIRGKKRVIEKLESMIVTDFT